MIREKFNSKESGRFPTIRRFATLTGYSEAAIRSKIQRGDWPQGHVWVRTPDQRLLIDVVGFEAWVTKQSVDC